MNLIEELNKTARSGNPLDLIPIVSVNVGDFLILLNAYLKLCDLAIETRDGKFIREKFRKRFYDSLQIRTVVQLLVINLGDIGSTASVDKAGRSLTKTIDRVMDGIIYAEEYLSDNPKDEVLELGLNEIKATLNK